MLFVNGLSRNPLEESDRTKIDITVNYKQPSTDKLKAIRHKNSNDPVLLKQQEIIYNG